MTLSYLEIKLSIIWISHYLHLDSLTHNTVCDFLRRVYSIHIKTPLFCRLIFYYTDWRWYTLLEQQESWPMFTPRWSSAWKGVVLFIPFLSSSSFPVPSRVESRTTWAPERLNVVYHSCVQFPSQIGYTGTLHSWFSLQHWPLATYHPLYMTKLPLLPLTYFWSRRWFE